MPKYVINIAPFSLAVTRIAEGTRQSGGQGNDLVSGAQSSPIFILSFRYRDELAALVEKGGWQAIAARRADGVEGRCIASGASIVIVDGRDAVEEARAAVASIGDLILIHQAILLVLLPDVPAQVVDQFYDAGATHYLTSASDDQILTTLRFLGRAIDRTELFNRAASRRAAAAELTVETWHWTPGHVDVQLNPALVRRLTGQPETRSGLSLLSLLGPEGRHAAIAALKRLKQRPVTAFAHSNPDPRSGHRRVVHHLRRDPETGAIIGQIEHLGGDLRGRDPLTRLEDLRAARQWIDSKLRARRRSPVLVLVLSLSRFGMINAAFGRSTGDSLLQGVARRLDRIVGDGGTAGSLVARLPGAQFLIGLSDGATLDQARILADQIVEALARPFLSQDHVISLSCRIGISANDEDGDDVDSLLRRANVALVDAKEGEGSPVRILRSTEENETERESRLEIDLRIALDEDRIDILFQPQVSVLTGEIIGVEALARWRHPRFGELGATTLFAAAERSDYLQELSAHVQRKALTIAAAWPEELRSLRVSINITAADMVRPHFATQLLELVDVIGFPRDRLTVELTESGLIEDLDMAAELLARLRAGGLRAAIDDFGTGYSSLTYLKSLPFDYLKIDKRFAQDIAGEARDRIVVRSVIDMARSLGLSVIAEGVESEEQLDLLAAAGCHIYQGFLCAPPLDSHALEALVTRRFARPLVG
ncbi:putative bifunctional diguanylate cyclase/phosphodiesterase [Sphingomonas sp. ID0503]|uniref:putative bifunctional diguanylate cyclase/phosphodiesterase n=1 Tax=Sphingomonas sp. ID0503 TaxID=3399691 RepID=UPI003AFB0F58